MELYALLQDKLNYSVAIILIMLGIWAMIGKRNLMKKLVGMVIFQSAIIMFFVSMSVKEGATIPILYHDELHAAEHDSHVVEATTEDEAHHGDSDESHDSHATEEVHAAGINPDKYANPLPHVLMLTAIVVGVATLGVALAIVLKLYEGYGTIEEDEIDERIRHAVDDEDSHLEGFADL